MGGFQNQGFGARSSGVCYDWQKAQCNRGTSCRFAPCNGTPVVAGGGLGRAPPSGGFNSNFGRSRGVCFDWQKGQCDRGNACRFSHSEDGSDVAPPQVGGINPNFGRSRGVCFDWQKGVCERGDNCRFTHSNEAEGADGTGPYASHHPRRFQLTRPGDWSCPACGVNNFASRTQCFKCNVEKPEVLDQQMGAGGFQQGGFGLQGNVRPGDWNCPSCQINNFASR